MNDKTNLTELLKTWKLTDLAKALGVTTADLKKWKIDSTEMPEKVRQDLKNLANGFMIV